MIEYGPMYCRKAFVLPQIWFILDQIQVKMRELMV